MTLCTGVSHGIIGLGSLGGQTRCHRILDVYFLNNGSNFTIRPVAFKYLFSLLNPLLK